MVLAHGGGSGKTRAKAVGESIGQGFLQGGAFGGGVHGDLQRWDRPILRRAFGADRPQSSQNQAVAVALQHAGAESGNFPSKSISFSRVAGF